MLMICGNINDFIDHPYLKILYPHMGPSVTPGPQVSPSKCGAGALDRLSSVSGSKIRPNFRKLIKEIPQRPPEIP